MSTTTAVLLETAKLDDLLELTRLAEDRLRTIDPQLADALHGARAEVRVSAIPDVDV